jgi:hypothetical protein
MYLLISGPLMGGPQMGVPKRVTAGGPPNKIKEISKPDLKYCLEKIILLVFAGVLVDADNSWALASILFQPQLQVC